MTSLLRRRFPDAGAPQPIDGVRPAVSLPFAQDIPVRSYLDHALPLSIVAFAPAHRLALFGSFIQMFFPEQKLDYDRVLMLPSLRTPDWERLGFLRSEAIDPGDASLRRPEGLFGRLIDWLNQGWFVELHIDEYFLPGRPCHQRIHSVHDNMLVGYALPTGCFQVAGYGQDYEIADIPFTDVLHAFCDVRRLDRSRRYVRLIAPVPGVVTRVDLAAVRAQLDHYVSSTATRSAADLRRDPPYRRARRVTGRWGMAVYAAYREWIRATVASRAELDLRATRTLWEHKACMLARLRHFEREGYLDARAGLSDRYAVVETLARAVRFGAYEYNTAGRSVSPLRPILEALDAMRDAEAPVLEAVLTALPRVPAAPGASAGTNGGSPC